MKSALIQEEWRPVVGYAGLYDASNFGRVRSLGHWTKNWRSNCFKKGRILKPGKKEDGYLYVILCKDGKIKYFSVHRLVYETFNGTIPDGMEVNHINEIKTDNSVWNLNLMTRKENINYGNRNQKVKEKLSQAVLQLTLDDELIKEWPSIAEAGRNGFSQGDVYRCCIGKLKTHKGFKWVKKNPV